jgi:hypothetical protein
MEILSFIESRGYVQSLGLKSQREWKLFCASGKRPKNIPSNPQKTYKNKGWIGFPDFLGYKKGWDGTYWSFKKTRDFVRKLKLTKKSDWDDYCKSGIKPHYIPNDPSSKYIGEFKGYPDFLGYVNDRKPMKRGYNIERWTLCKVIEISKRYNDIKEFQQKERKCYVKAKRMGILNYVTNHMVKYYGIQKRYLYKIEFPKKVVYIGLTYDVNKRELEHLTINSKRLTSVGEYIKKTGIKPETKVLEYGDVKKMKHKESDYIEHYKRKGYILLNKSDGGELGTSFIRYTKEYCLSVAKKYETRGELKTNNNGVYQKMVKKGWLDEGCKHMSLRYVKNRWTKESCRLEALKYKTKNEFIKKSGSCYVTSKKCGWFDEITKHMICGRIKKNKKDGLPLYVSNSKNKKNPYMVRVKGKYVGYYPTIEEAIIARNIYCEKNNITID